MKKDIKDYLHLYLGQKCLIGDSDTIEYIRMVTENGYSICTGTNDKNIQKWFKSSACKPILRPLSDLSHDELKSIRTPHSEFDHSPISGRWGQKVSYGFTTDPMQWEFQITLELVKMGFDIFGLIEAGLAIDKTTIK